MTDVLIVCLTVLLIAAALASLSVWHAKHEAEREDKLAAREETEAASVANLTERLSAALETLPELRAAFVDANKESASAILALSERVAIMEAAMKAAIAQMVDVTQYTQAKHQQMIAASVRGGSSKRPGAGA